MWLSADTAAATASIIPKVVEAVERLAARKHGALIVFQRIAPLQDYINTGVLLDAIVSPELILQIFYPNTPLHDGALIIVRDRLAAAACVLPLSSSGVLAHSPERQMGLRHRAALGLSETTDAVVVVVSEERGSISLAHAGTLHSSLSAAELTRMLEAYFPTYASAHRSLWSIVLGFWRRLLAGPDDEGLS